RGQPIERPAHAPPSRAIDARRGRQTMMELLLQAERQLSVGQLDAAERLYWQAIENDPKNSIAVVGLARVSLDRGDDRTAYQFARKALEIDAENAAALRLVARLGEVMTFRGEEPPTEQTPSRRHDGDAARAGRD